MIGIRLRALATAAGVSCVGWATGALAGTPEDVQAALQRLQQQTESQAAELARQRQLLTDQRAKLEQQQQEIDQLRQLSDPAMRTARGTGVAPVETSGTIQIPVAETDPSSVGRVGEAPPEAPPVAIASVPQEAGVLTPRGKLVLEPQIDFTHGSTNRLVFRGVEIVTGIQIGLIEASDADRNAFEAAIDARYGLTNRIELELRAPYVYRYDRITTLAQRDQTITLSESLRGHGVGDVEVAGRYQVNSGAGGLPIFIAGLRVKSDTGTNPYTIQRDQYGVAEKLATGSGFWGVETSLNMLYPSDPAVIYAGISYLNQLPRTFDTVVDGALLGRVKPGASYTANMGFGFALNPRFSFSLGYKHTFIARTKLELGGTVQRSQSLQVGAFTLGWAFALTPRLTITNTYNIGTTRDAPDMEVMLRIPYRF